MYKYAKIKNIHLNMLLNPVKVTYILFFKAKPLGYVYSIKRIRKTLRIFLNVLFVTVEYCMVKYKVYTNGIYEFEACGDILLVVRNGYKVFDFNDDKVTKLFDQHESESSIKMEIDNAIAAAKYDFAPDVIEVDDNMRYYTEEYINGKRIDYINDWNTWVDNFSVYVLPLIKRFVTIAMDSVNGKSYLAEKKEKINKKLYKNDQIDASKLHKIKEFLNRYERKVNDMGYANIDLVFSHGDFSQKHILQTKDRVVKVIDWETLGLRSVLFDYYNCFFVRYRSKDKVKKKEFMIAIKNALTDLCQIITTDDNLSGSGIEKDFVSNQTYYRYIYYFERICRIIELQKIDDKIIDVVLNWIDSFERFEDNLKQEG